jgi:30S ribosomal protein S31
MGKGDQRSKRGKIVRGTFGKSRPQKIAKKAAQPKAEVKAEESQEKA